MVRLSLRGRLLRVGFEDWDLGEELRNGRKDD